MNMDYNPNDKELSIAMAEGMSGDWTFNIIPKTLNITDISVDNDKLAEEATCEETLFTLPDDRENQEFYVEYKSLEKSIENCTVFGTVQAENGKTYEMKLGNDISDPNHPKYYLSYELPFALAGDYTIRIYHYPEETTIGSPVVRDKVETQQDIIIIEG